MYMNNVEREVFQLPALNSCPVGGSLLIGALAL